MKRIIFAVALFACLAIVPLLTTREYILSLIILVCLYTILSHSWNLLGGFTGQISLGHSTFFGVGALVFRYLWLQGVPSYLALGAGSLSSLVLACVIGFPSFKLKGHYFSIGTLALAMIALITVQNVFPGVSFVPQEYLKTYSLIPIYYMAIIAGAVTIWVIYALTRSKLGLALLSVREDEDAAEAIGVNAFKYKVISMSLSTLIAGMGGGVFSFYVASYYYYVPFDLNYSFDPVLITFIGGPGTVLGPVVGSICFVLLKELFAISLGQMNVLIFGIVFILTILFLPEGLVGLMKKLRRTKRVQTVESA
ncbi:MAG: branched-chain amino acid ABC transporter permease [Deltaproteobacteria bacterium]